MPLFAGRYTYGLAFGWDAGNNQFYNNTVYNVENGVGTDNASAGIVRNNIFYQTDVPIVGSGDVTFSNNLIDINPVFANPSTSDFHLQSTSPARDAGMTISTVPTDFDGVSRPVGSAYDIGAYEYGGTAPSPTPTPSSSPSPACSLYTSSSPIPAGFGSPYDVAFAPTSLLFSVSCTSSSVSATLGTGSSMQYIYNTGYLYKTGGTNWTPVSYTSPETLISNAWYPKSANTTIPMTPQELQSTSYILGYLCTWTGSQWKCGCRDSQCTQSYWQIQKVQQ